MALKLTNRYGAALNGRTTPPAARMRVGALLGDLKHEQDYRTIRADIVLVDAMSRIRNGIDTELENLAITAQSGSAVAPGYDPWYGFDVEYRDVFSVNAVRATRMASTLRFITRGLARLAERRGAVRSFGDYLGRVLEVLDDRPLVVVAVRRGSLYTNGEYVFNELAEGIAFVDQLTRRDDVVQQFVAKG